MKKVRKDPYKLLRIYFLIIFVVLTIPVIASLSANQRSFVLSVIVLLYFAYRFRERLIPLFRKVRLPKFRRVYLTIFILFAFFGIFVMGFILGALSQGEINKDKIDTNKSEKSAQMTDVLNNYQGLSRLFYLQQQDMDIITNISGWENNPQEIYDAIYSYKQKKNEILFQWGRLYELRKKAGLSTDTYLKLD